MDIALIIFIITSFILTLVLICAIINCHHTSNKVRILEEYNDSIRKDIESKNRIIEKSKRDFSDMNFEIRGPLNSILGTIGLLQSTSMDEEQKKYTRVCKKNTVYLTRLIDDMFIYSKYNPNISTNAIVNCSINIRRNEFNMEEMINDIIDYYISQIPSIELVIDIDPGICDKYIISDERKILQIILNLLSNSIKFTTKGEIIIMIKIVSGAKDVLIMEVKDTGIGISKQDMKNIFKPKINSNKEFINTHGRRIGLVVCKMIVDAMNGSITCDSEIDCGTTFSIELPIKKNYNLERIKRLRLKNELIKEKLKDKNIYLIDNSQTSNFIIKVLKYYEKDISIINKEDISKFITNMKKDKNNEEDNKKGMRENIIIINSKTTSLYKYIKNTCKVNVLMIYEYKDRIDKEEDYIIKPIKVNEFIGTILKLINLKMDIKK